MANQDYVSRTPAKKKKTHHNGKKPAKTANKSSSKSTLISLLLIVLLTAFIYALWSLKTDPSTKTPLVEPIKSVKEKSVSKKTNELPKPPKEKWTYVKDLETKEVEVGKYKVEEKGP